MPADQAPMSNTNTPTPEKSDDEVESQETDSVIGDPDVSLGCSDWTDREVNSSFATLSRTFRTSVLGENNDPLDDDFITVQYTRRPHDQPSKPVAPDRQNQFSVERVAETSRPLATVTTQPTPYANTAPKMQQMHLRAGTEIQGNPNRSTNVVPDSSSNSALEEFPILGNVSSVNISGAARRNFKPPDGIEIHPLKPPLPSTLQRFREEEAKRNPNTEQNAANSSQGLSGHLSSSSSAGHSKSSSIPDMITLSQNSVTAQKPHVDQQLDLSDPRKVPEGVYVVCDHFLRENLRRSSSISEPIKTCRVCGNRNMLKYAAWNRISGYWQEMRPYPASGVPPKATLDVCRHFATNRPCPKMPCTFPHGDLETAMWTKERQGGKYDSRTCPILFIK